ncbi:MAG: hypothetical protein AAFU54_29900 [Chloroflexota bacterium]
MHNTRQLLLYMMIVLLAGFSILPTYAQDGDDLPTCDRDSYLRILQELYPGTTRNEADMGYVLPEGTPPDVTLPSRAMEDGEVVVRDADGTILNRCIVAPPPATLTALTEGTLTLDDDALVVADADGATRLTIESAATLPPTDLAAQLASFYAAEFGVDAATNPAYEPVASATMLLTDRNLLIVSTEGEMLLFARDFATLPPQARANTLAVFYARVLGVFPPAPTEAE